LCRHSEIQELRHKPQTDGVDAKTTAEIDNAIMNMNERLEAIEQGMKDINESVTPFQPPENEPLDDTSERAVMLRKHAALQTEWDAVQRETDELQQELKEDKWITVFRTVTEQADGMMTSLEKAVNRCQVRRQMSCGTWY
jgi:DNA repair exonuclease SbcCD ATPase subunit